MHHFLSVLLVIALCVTPAVATAETAIPLGRTGHAFHRGNASALTTVEYYIDLTCSSCRDSWSLLNKVYDTYKEKVHFEYRIFPLPYHQQAFITAKAAQVANALGKDAETVFRFMDVSYEQQAQIYNTATADLTYTQVVDLVGTWAVAAGLTQEQYVLGMNSSSTVGNQCEMNARYMWKYVTLQGVYATPFFAIDGLKTMGLDTFEDWQNALDPLIL